MSNNLALSVRQPWAWLIVHADRYPNPKRIENRTWPTKVRGVVKIHASKTFDRVGYDAVLVRRPDLRALLPALDEFELGGIVGEVSIVDCVSDSADEWYTGNFGYVLSQPRPLPFTACSGRQRFFYAGGRQREIDPRQLWLFPLDDLPSLGGIAASFTGSIPPSSACAVKPLSHRVHQVCLEFGELVHNIDRAQCMPK